MIIGLTGHTKNLGQKFYNHFLEKGHKILGFSRTNGWNIPNDIEKICNEVEKYDLFINNVHFEDSQCIFLERLYDKIPIITSGSMAANFALTHKNPYYLQKYKVEQTHIKLKKLTDNPMLLLKMGYLENYIDKKPISYDTIINAIELWLENPRISMIEFENHKDIYGGG